MDSSKASNVTKGTSVLQNSVEEIVTEIISLEVEKEIEHVLVTTERPNDPCCSGIQQLAPGTSESDPPALSLPDDITDPSPATSPKPNSTQSYATTSIIPLRPSFSSPPELQPSSARARDPHIVSMSDFGIFPLHGPPPSYSKSLLDRRINPCASIQFVAPIPPPSYEGCENELRYGNTTGYSAFTLGLGNTWQSQSQPAYCPICETVIITQVALRSSRTAHVCAVVLCLMFCWPCCALPYFISACNYTVHRCSVCNVVLGVRAPFQRS